MLSVAEIIESLAPRQRPPAEVMAHLEAFDLVERSVLRLLANAYDLTRLPAEGAPAPDDEELSPTWGEAVAEVEGWLFLIDRMREGLERVRPRALDELHRLARRRKLRPRQGEESA